MALGYAGALSLERDDSLRKLPYTTTLLRTVMKSFNNQDFNGSFSFSMSSPARARILGCKSGPSSQGEAASGECGESGRWNVRGYLATV